MSDFRWTWLDRVESEESPASRGGRHLANVLVRHHVRRGDDVCWVGVRRVARVMGVSRTTAAHYFKELQQFGFLRTTRRPNGQTSLHQLVIPESVSTVTPGRTVARSRGGRTEKSGTPGGTVSVWLQNRKASRPEGHTVTPGVTEPLTSIPLTVDRGETHRPGEGEIVYCAICHDDKPVVRVVAGNVYPRCGHLWLEDEDAA